jgi:hypothetical protein
MTEQRIGIYPGITAKEYHTIEAVSNSYLSRLKRLPQEDTAAFLFGRAFHCLLLEGPETFNTLFAVIPEEINKRTKEGKATLEAFEKENAEKDLIEKEDYEQMIEMVNAVIRHPFAAKVLKEGRSEQSVFWADKETGLYCKCRPDRIPEGEHGVILDVKTSRDATQAAFTKSIASFGYHRQASFYIDGFNAVSNAKVDAFIFIAVEKEPPYVVGCYTLSDIDLDVGRVRYRELMEKEKECQDKGEWPNYESEGLIEVNLPMWA